ncbi:hypothetical protein [Nocardia gipuzkoensis]
MKRYLADWEAITACETKRDQDIAALRQQISDVESRAAEEIARHRANQAEAAVVIRDHGASDEDVAELLEISPKQARQLVAAARANRDTTAPEASPTPITAPTTHRLQETPHIIADASPLAQRVSDPAELHALGHPTQRGDQAT